ncbi:hypothetical protein GQ53DRAFT_463221 [Thozetella sp. PMI_491]|nr:hypothetical protein GQ53DRAFT_463221 [Thozetella sp. PMI_491]
MPWVRRLGVLFRGEPIAVAQDVFIPGRPYALPAPAMRGEGLAALSRTRFRPEELQGPDPLGREPFETPVPAATAAMFFFFPLLFVRRKGGAKRMQASSLTLRTMYRATRGLETWKSYQK